MPEHIQNCDEEVDLHGFKVPTWRAWSVENWGTKWNAYDARFSTKDPEHTVEVDTAWAAPPVALFKSLAMQFPTHEIVIHSDEYGNHSQKLHSDGWAGCVCRRPVPLLRGNSEPLCVVNSMLWKSRKRRPAGHIPIAFAPHVGDFVGEQRRIGRRKAGDRRLACPGNSGKQKSLSPANRTGGMNQEASLPGQDERVNDAQDTIDGVGTVRLTDVTMAGVRIPACSEITPLQQPFACFDLYLQAIIGYGGFRGLVQIDVELEV